MDMVVDRVTRKPAPLSANQLARALEKAGVVSKPKPQQPQPADDAKIVADVRAWLAKLVAGERVPTPRMSDRLPGNKIQAIVNRLKQRDLIAIKMGQFGGATATPRLIELARVNISDEELKVIAFTDVPHVADEDPRDIKADEDAMDVMGVHRDDADKPPPLLRREDRKPRPVFRTAAQRDAYMMKTVRGWLRSGANGKKLRIAHIAGASSGNAYGIAYRIRDAGYIERRGAPGNIWYVVPDNMRELVLTLNDEQIVGLIWPGRFAVEVDVPVDEPVAQAVEETQDDVVVEPAVETAREPVANAAAEDPIVLLAMRMGQFLDVLERVDARLGRLEQAWGLPPLGQETSK